MTDELSDGSTRQHASYEPGPEDLSFRAFMAAKKAGLITPGTTRIDKEKTIKRMAEVMLERVAPPGFQLPTFVVADASELGSYINQHHPEYQLVHVIREGKSAAMLAHRADVSRSPNRVSLEEFEDKRRKLDVMLRLGSDFTALDTASQRAAVDKLVETLALEAERGDEDAQGTLQYLLELGTP